MALPKRDAGTMVDAIALSSPSGRMSKRARQAAERRLADKLFGDYKPTEPKQPTEAERLRRHAKRLRDLADRGMSTRKFNRQASILEAKADKLECFNGS